MAFFNRIGGAAFGAAMLLGAGLCAPPAQAAYIVTLAQVGSNVVATGSGTIDLAALTLVRGSVPFPPTILPAGGIILTGGAPASFDVYQSVTGPTSFGSGIEANAGSSSGDDVGIYRNEFVLVPAGYVSGDTLASSATWDGKTFASLGATPGSYVWNWGSGPTADSFTLDIGVPEPSGVLLLALPVGLVGLLSLRPRRPNSRPV